MNNLKWISLEVVVNVLSNEGFAELSIKSDNADMNGIVIFCENSKYGDKITFEILDLENNIILSYLEKVMLSTNIDLINLLHNSNEECITLNSKLKLKITYSAVDTTGRKCVFWIKLKE